MQVQDFQDLYQNLNDELNLSQRVQRTEDYATKCGGFADIWEGTLIGEATHGKAHLEANKVAVKVIREVGTELKTVQRRLVREMRAWSKLSHRNVLPLLGYVNGWLTGLRLPSLVAPWMKAGTSRHYLENVAEANRWKIVSGIADGLYYLHRHDVIHGDLKGDNVLIDREGRAQIADFGLSKVLNEASTTGNTITTEAIGSVPWTARELIAFESSSQPPVTAESDVWAYGMTVLELWTLKNPYSELGMHSMALMFRIYNGTLPEYPTECAEPLSNDLWDLCQSCWLQSSVARPRMREVALRIDQLKPATPSANSQKRRSPETDEVGDSSFDSISTEDSDYYRPRKSPKLAPLDDFHSKSIISPKQRSFPLDPYPPIDPSKLPPTYRGWSRDSHGSPPSWLHRSRRPSGDSYVSTEPPSPALFTSGPLADDLDRDGYPDERGLVPTFSRRRQSRRSSGSGEPARVRNMVRREKEARTRGGASPALSPTALLSASPRSAMTVRRSSSTQYPRPASSGSSSSSPSPNLFAGRPLRTASSSSVSTLSTTDGTDEWFTAHHDPTTNWLGSLRSAAPKSLTPGRTLSGNTVVNEIAHGTFVQPSPDTKIGQRQHVHDPRLERHGGSLHRRPAPYPPPHHPPIPAALPQPAYSPHTQQLYSPAYIEPWASTDNLHSGTQLTHPPTTSPYSSPYLQGASFTHLPAHAFPSRAFSETPEERFLDSADPSVGIFAPRDGESPALIPADDFGDLDDDDDDFGGALALSLLEQHTARAKESPTTSTPRQRDVASASPRSTTESELFHHLEHSPAIPVGMSLF